MQSGTMSAVVERLKRARRVAIFTHLRPDPDALGSQAAAAQMLTYLGAIEVYRMQFAEAPGPYRFLQENAAGETAMWGSEWAGSAGGVIDTILVVDTCTYQQMEPAQGFLKAERSKVVAIDHHVSRDDLASLVFADTSAAAAVEILWGVAREAGVPMTKELALPLMAGLVGDTGWFRFDSVTERTHRMASELVQHVNAADLYERLMQNETRTKLGLMERALRSVRWESKDRFAGMVLRQADFRETGATASQTEYLVDMPMMVGTTEVVALLSEMPDGRVKVSLRSKHEIDVNRICNAFGGGGHKKAAGCTISGPVDAAYTRLAAEVCKAVEAS